MTRDKLETAVWQHTAALCGSHPADAMDAILRAADAYARAEAMRAWDESARSMAARVYPPDDPAVTAERRRILAEALAPDPRTARSKTARAEAAWGRPEDEEAA